MINLKIKLTRVFDESFKKERLLKEIIDRVKEIFKEGKIIDTGLGQGFTVQFGKPKTLKEYLFYNTPFTPVINMEHVNQIKNLIG